ncbi:MAG: ABC transporter ATP-binding protein [Cellulosilyticaceae bacterium]
MLHIENFSKIYKSGKPAVNNLSIHVSPGDIYGFIGHNGAGKSTTIKAVVGVLDFEQGKILIDNNSIQEKPLLCKKKIAYLPDNPDLYEHLSGIGYLNFIADLYEISSNNRNNYICKYAAQFEITDRLGDLISSYSHGMKQKLALISAIIRRPKLLVLDEPFVGLDPKASMVLKNIMKEITLEGGAIFFSTHVLEVAEKLCNKIAIIKDGELIVSGQTQELIKDASLENLFMEVVDNV